MKSTLIAYLVTGLAFLGCDSVWLTITGQRLYHAYLGPLLTDNFALAPAIAFYLIYIAGVIGLVVRPALADGRISVATLRGALLGLSAYATYDLTNQSTMRGWPTIITVADLCWGTVLTAVAATIGTLVTGAIVRPR
jgi:uncharacterized membrane protein